MFCRLLLILTSGVKILRGDIFLSHDNIFVNITLAKREEETVSTTVSTVFSLVVWSISGLTRDGKTDPVARDPGAHGDRGYLKF